MPLTVFNMAKVLVLGSLAKMMVKFRGELLRDLVAAGHDVYACAPQANESIRTELLDYGVTFHNVNLSRAGLNPFRDIVFLLRMFRIFRSIQPDLFFGYTIKPVIYGSVAARLARVSNIYSMITGLGYAFVGSTLKSKIVGFFASRLYAFSLQFNKKVFFQNENDSDLFQRKRLVNRNQIVIINGSGVDTDKYFPTPFPENLSFLLIARLLKDKGVYEYIEAARSIKQNFPKVVFGLVGWIDENPSAILKEDLQSWVKEGLINFYGKLDDVRPAISNCSVYVLPSYREGTPRSVLEAMAMGRPIITTDAPGCRETVIDGVNGYLVPVQDAIELAKRMEHFVRNQDLLEKMGKQSRKIAESKYDVHKVNQAILTHLALVNDNHKEG